MALGEPLARANIVAELSAIPGPDKPLWRNDCRLDGENLAAFTKRERLPCVSIHDLILGNPN